ncbi:hypothetical protein BaRGS_00024085 [Batillaria attramentaria]|uniref:Uncharacterized protein n=1 Tax=Batillaria attramentaria TaxID=370345 RepID=A0ABD0KC87_9CAEN
MMGFVVSGRPCFDISPTSSPHRVGWYFCSRGMSLFFTNISSASTSLFESPPEELEEELLEELLEELEAVSAWVMATRRVPRSSRRSRVFPKAIVISC